MPAGERQRRAFFVSFNSADRGWGEWIAKELEDAGKTAIYQHWDFRPGSNFVLEMDRATRLADRLIAVLSESYLKALFTQPEWAAYFASDPTGAGRKIVPVRVQECNVDGLLKPLVYIDLVGCEEAECRKRLHDGVKEDRAKPEFVPFPGAWLAATRAGTPVSGLADLGGRGESGAVFGATGGRGEAPAGRGRCGHRAAAAPAAAEGGSPLRGHPDRVRRGAAGGAAGRAGFGQEHGASEAGGGPVSGQAGAAHDYALN
jgi:hypothetical protein